MKVNLIDLIENPLNMTGLKKQTPPPAYPDDKLIIKVLEPEEMSSVSISGEYGIY